MYKTKACGVMRKNSKEGRNSMTTQSRVIIEHTPSRLTT